MSEITECPNCLTKIGKALRFRWLIFWITNPVLPFIGKLTLVNIFGPFKISINGAKLKAFARIVAAFIGNLIKRPVPTAVLEFINLIPDNTIYQKENAGRVLVCFACGHKEIIPSEVEE